jgi:hypothetical protein
VKQKDDDISSLLLVPLQQWTNPRRGVECDLPMAPQDYKKDIAHEARRLEGRKKTK